MRRAFCVAPGRTVTLPQGLRAGPGATNLRLAEGAKVIVDLSGDRAQFGRFVENRKTVGDWTEIDPASVPDDQDGAGDAVQHVPDPNKPGAGETGLKMAAPTTPGGVVTGRSP